MDPVSYLRLTETNRADLRRVFARRRFGLLSTMMGS
jgi:hypothetical protein